jgi:hypothetical protein
MPTTREIQRDRKAEKEARKAMAELKFTIKHGVFLIEWDLRAPLAASQQSWQELQQK